jgi:hypothetical protein
VTFPSGDGLLLIFNTEAPMPQGIIAKEAITTIFVIK